MGNRSTLAGWLRGLPLAILGSLLIALALSVPVFASAPLLAFFLMSVPMFFSGAVALLHGVAVMFTRIVISERALSLAVPAWHGFPVLPVRRVELQWHELMAIRRRREVSRLPGGLTFPVTVFALETGKGRIILGERSTPDLREALVEMMRRTGLVLQDDGEVTSGLIRTLLRGSPPWPERQ